MQINKFISLFLLLLFAKAGLCRASSLPLNEFDQVMNPDAILASSYHEDTEVFTQTCFEDFEINDSLTGSSQVRFYDEESTILPSDPVVSSILEQLISDHVAINRKFVAVEYHSSNYDGIFNTGNLKLADYYQQKINKGQYYDFINRCGTHFTIQTHKQTTLLFILVFDSIGFEEDFNFKNNMVNYFTELGSVNPGETNNTIITLRTKLVENSEARDILMILTGIGLSDWSLENPLPISFGDVEPFYQDLINQSLDEQSGVVTEVSLVSWLDFLVPYDNGQPQELDIQAWGSAHSLSVDFISIDQRIKSLSENYLKGYMCLNQLNEESEIQMLNHRYAVDQNISRSIFLEYVNYYSLEDMLQIQESTVSLLNTCWNKINDDIYPSDFSNIYECTELDSLSKSFNTTLFLIQSYCPLKKL